MNDKIDLSKAIQGLSMLTGGQNPLGNLGQLASITQDNGFRGLVGNLMGNSDVTNIANLAIQRLKGGMNGAQQAQGQAQVPQEPLIKPEQIQELTETLKGLSSAQSNYLNSQARVLDLQARILEQNSSVPLQNPLANAPQVAKKP